MTLILTCALRDHVIQVADRKVTAGGRVIDTDRNKAVFYCGRAAIAYSGPASISGIETSRWLGQELTKHEDIEAGLLSAASAANTYVRSLRTRDRKCAFVATGWATFNHRPPPRPYICVVSNFISDTGEWLAEAQDSFRQVVGAVIPGVSHLFLPAGAWLSHTEIDDINGAIRRVLKAKRGPIAIAELLGETIRAVSAAGGERGATVGKALIVQLLSREAHESGNARIVSPLTPDAHSFLYLSEENEIQPAQSAWIACGGALIQGYVGPRAGGSFD